MDERNTALTGGGFLIADAAAADVRTPEDLTAEQRELGAAVGRFMERKVVPNSRDIELQLRDDNEYVWTLPKLMHAAGQSGFTGADIPEEYGGLGLDPVSSAVIFEAIGAGGSGSFAVTIGAHAGIGTWPILYFGSEAQRQKYLPKIASGETIAAYALTEPGSGSDALGAKCSAVLAKDGSHWIVNGEKTFITNAGFAGVFTVFVKIRGQNACLIVERGTPGLGIGKEEHKLGIKGSSTCSLRFEEARVPVENLLGAVGKGHKIVLNTLNLGRFKLGAGCVGGMKSALDVAVKYAGERKQFGKPILKFDAVRQKLADMAIKAWVGESMVYRVAGLLAANLHGVAPGEQASKAIEEFSLECALIKVALSEMLWDSVNHAVQIHGGYGYIEDFPVARALRDARINLIFEGTNEINRMLMIDALMKRAMTGKLDLMGAVAKLDEPFSARQNETPWLTCLEHLKRLTRHVLAETVKTHMMTLKDDDKQQLLIELADMLIGVFSIESALLRGEKVHGPVQGSPDLGCVILAHLGETAPKVVASATRVLSALQKYGGDPPPEVIIPKQYWTPCRDTIKLRQSVVWYIEEKGGYPF